MIDHQGNQVGLIDTEKALQMAESIEMDLVEISSTSNPPVCKIMDYGKHLYSLRKKKADAKKNQKQVQLKEVKFRPVTEEGDYQVKLKKLTKFLLAGDKTKVTLRFKGREITHQELGYHLLQRVQHDLAEYAVVESEAKRDGRSQMVMILSSKSKK